jgi:hypothetical protein
MTGDMGANWPRPAFHALNTARSLTRLHACTPTYDGYVIGQWSNDSPEIAEPLDELRRVVLVETNVGEVDFEDGRAWVAAVEEHQLRLAQVHRGQGRGLDIGVKVTYNTTNKNPTRKCIKKINGHYSKNAEVLNASLKINTILSLGTVGPPLV